MTAYRFVTLTCDECYEIWDDGQSKKIRDARASAKTAGWIFRDGQDLCPVHLGYHRTAFGYERDDAVPGYSGFGKPLTSPAPSESPRESETA